MTAIATSITAASVPGSSIAGVARPPLKPRPRVHSVQSRERQRGPREPGQVLEQDDGIGRRLRRQRAEPVGPRLRAPPRREIGGRACRECEGPGGAERQRDRAARRRRWSRSAACATTRSASGRTTAVATSHSGPMKPRARNAKAVPSPSTAPPATGRRSASAKPYCATAMPREQPEFRRKLVRAVPQADRTDEQQHGHPAEIAPGKLLAGEREEQSVSASRRPAASRAASCSDRKPRSVSR